MDHSAQGDGRNDRSVGMAMWIARHPRARLAAAGWWFVMIVCAGTLIGGWISLVMNPDGRHLFSALALTLIAGITLSREWRCAELMRALLLGHEVQMVRIPLTTACVGGRTLERFDSSRAR
jgi:hypothetical protein